MKELYGSGILLFYFFKWPYLIAYSYMSMHGLQRNIVLDAIWIYCVILVLKDIYMLIKNKNNPKSCRPKKPSDYSNTEDSDQI